MPAPAHIVRHVDAVDTIDISSDQEETLRRIEATLLQSEIRRAIVMPSQGIILVFRTAYNYSESKEDTAKALSTALRGLGFFTETTPPLEIPDEIVTPVEGADPHYLVEITLHPERKTVYHLMM